MLWHHVVSADNPADQGSRGDSVTGAQLRWNGPTWLKNPANCPPEVLTKTSPESLAERKVQQELFAVGVEGKSDFKVVLEMFDLQKALRIGAWVARFLRNSRDSTNKPKGPLSIVEVMRHKTFLDKRAQQEGFNNVSFKQGQAQLNLQPNEEGVLKCRGRIQGEYPVYLPDTALLVAKIVQRAHITKLHGGVRLTMASEESCKKMQWLQTVSSHSFHRSAISTFAKTKNRRQHALQRNWCGFCSTG